MQAIYSSTPFSSVGGLTFLFFCFLERNEVVRGASLLFAPAPMTTSRPFREARLSLLQPPFGVPSRCAAGMARSIVIT